ncbi:MAG: D-aminoacyl-tRNA deacylase [Anaerolineaceae bacterium]
MRAVVQRVSQASVAVAGDVVAEIHAGFLVLLGVTSTDTPTTAHQMATKVIGLRIFNDEGGRMNLGLRDVAGAVLCVSQFTLYGNVRRGRRPSFETAAAADVARPLYEAFCEAILALGVPCERGRFGEHMIVSLVNDGPVTLVIDSAEMDVARRT